MKLSRVLLAPWSFGLALTASSALLSASAHGETLSQDAAVARAVDQSPSLRAALLDVQAARQSLSAEESARGAVLNASVSGGLTESPTASTTGLTLGLGKTVESRVSASYTTDVGTRLELGTVGDATVRAAPPELSPAPTYSGLAYVTVRQPLMRGAGVDANLAPITQARASQTAAEKEQESDASQTLLNVISAYWELWYAQEAIAVDERALALAEQQFADANTRAETLGTGSKVDALSFASQVASTRDALSQARAARSARAVELGRLLGMSAAASRDLEADGPLPPQGPLGSPDALVAKALEASPDLAAARARLAASRTQLASAEDADQPQVDLFATATSGVMWAEDDLPGLTLAGSRPAFSVVGGVELSLPLGDGRAKWDAARARTQQKAAELRYEASVEQVRADVFTLATNLAAADEQVALAAETARLAEALADAERQRLDLGLTTAIDVVKAEQTSRDAELRKLRADVSRVTAHTQIEHKTNALLGRFSGRATGKPS